LIKAVDCISRFITYGDVKETHIVYDLPEAWWSRHYEYVWAGRFATSSDVVLDVACGVCHPFKFYLGTIAKEVYACDSDPRILSKNEIIQDIKESIGEKVCSEFDDSLFDNVQLALCDMTQMPYADNRFDKVYCISVLEHVDELVQLKALLEFARVLKDDGLIVLTVDYPNVHMDSLMELMKKANLKFYGDYDFSVPDNAISTTMWGPELKCIRLLLCKMV
jgi:ubiquinone/menaquinone biosynthesis C-methylase UbiE